MYPARTGLPGGNFHHSPVFTENPDSSLTSSTNWKYKLNIVSNYSHTLVSCPQTRSFNSTILSLILVRYRFSIKLWAERFSVFTPPCPLEFVRRLMGILLGSKTIGMVAVRTPLGPWDNVGWICDWLKSIVPMTVAAESDLTICGWRWA